MTSINHLFPSFSTAIMSTLISATAPLKPAKAQTGQRQESVAKGMKKLCFSLPAFLLADNQHKVNATRAGSSNESSLANLSFRRLTLSPVLRQRLSAFWLHSWRELRPVERLTLRKGVHAAGLCCLYRNQPISGGSFWEDGPTFAL